MNKQFAFWRFGIMLIAVMSIIACAAVETVTTVATTVGEATGTISRQQGMSIRKSTAQSC